MAPSTIDEATRVIRLLDAQDKAARLFDEVSDRGMVRAGIGERHLSDEFRDLAADMFGVTRHWHKRIVQAGPNTLETFKENPPDRVIAEDDIVFLDFGPIFEEWEADFGRTFVLGDDRRKLDLRDDLPIIWQAGRDHFGGHIAGHLVGEFPHERIAGDEIESYIAPGSTQPMRRNDRSGRVCHWILEVHLVDTQRGFGGFHEELLDLP